MVKKPLKAALYTLLGALVPRPRPVELPTRPLPDLPLGRRGGEPPECWQADPRSGYRWPRVHGKFVEYRGARGDLRSAWEAHRFRWVEPKDFWRVFTDWASKNHPPLGIAWSSGLEVAARAINIAFLAERAGLNRAQKGFVDGWLLAHLRFLEGEPDRGVPNHELGWALGVFALRGYLGLEAREAWENFLKVAESQFLPDGFQVERATGYHLFATEALLLGLALARAWGFEHGRLAELAERALEAAAYLERPDGSFPVIGDFDDGGFLRPRAEPYLAFLRDLADAAGLGFPKFKEKVKFFENSGYLTMRGDRWHLAARLRDNPSLPGSHLHEDLGCFDFWPSSPDPGVYRYSGEGSLRNELRRAAAHNGFWRGEAYGFPSPFTVSGRRDAAAWSREGPGFFAEHELFGARLRVLLKPEEGGVRITYSLEGEGWEGGLNLLRGQVSIDGADAQEGEGVYCPRYGELRRVRRLLIKPRQKDILILLRR